LKRQEALTQARKFLNKHRIEDASLEAEVLLRHVLSIDRASLFSALDEDISRAQETEYFTLIKRRCTGEPTAYITGHREFYGLDFIVNQDVLIPRPETELLVAKTLEFAGNHRLNSIADVGTGCGAIAISLAKNLLDARIFALDASDKALAVAGENCRLHGVSGRIALIQSDLLEALPEPIDVIIANLPYVKTAEIPADGPVSFEPLLALDGGESGLKSIVELCHQAVGKILPGGCLFLEIGRGQAGPVTNVISKLFPAAGINVYPDYAGIERVVGVYLT
jgi:release factor glutamine methyltransferase